MPDFRTLPFALAWILPKCAPTNSISSARAGPRPANVFATDLKCFCAGNIPSPICNVLNSARLYASMAHQNGGFKLFTHHFGPTQSADAICGSSSGPRDQRVLLRRFRQCRRRRDGRPRRMGSEFHLVRPRRQARSRAHDSVAEFAGAVLRAVHAVPRIRSQQRRMEGHGPCAVRKPRRESRRIHFARITESYRVNAPLLFERNNGISAIAKRLGPERTPESEIDDSFKNIAFAVQDACEAAMLALVKLAMQKTGCRNVCLAGGVALNSKANGKIQASGMVDKIFVQPAASDDGVALGAVFAPYLDGGGRLPMKPLRHAYLGPEYSDAEIEKALRTYKLRAIEAGRCSRDHRRSSRQRKNHRLVPGTDGVRPARARAIARSWPIRAIRK